MIKPYRKIVTIKAEQFDGSDYMCKKYNIILNNNNYYLVGNEVAIQIKIGDWVTSDKRRHPHVITNSIFRTNYVEAMNDRHRRIERQARELERNRFDKSAQAVMDGFKTLIKAVVDFYVEVFKAIVATLKPILTAIERYLMQQHKLIKWRKLNKRR